MADPAWPQHAWHHDTPSGSTTYVLPIVEGLIADYEREIGRPQLKIVDLGCGNGSLAARFAAKGHEVIGIDNSASGIEIARSRPSRARFELCSMYDDGVFDLGAADADCVISLEVVEHLMVPQRLFQVAERLLRRNGLLLVSTPYHGYLKNLALSLTNGWDRHFNVRDDAGHVKFFSDRALATMAKDHGFGALRFRGAGRLKGFWKSTVMSARKNAA